MCGGAHCLVLHTARAAELALAGALLPRVGAGGATAAAEEACGQAEADCRPGEPGSGSGWVGGGCLGFGARESLLWDAGCRGKG